MTITLRLADILDGIYASSALATLSRDCHSALLHPDHADALRHTVRDALGALAAAAPGGCIKVAGVSDTSIDIDVLDTVDSLTATELLRCALVRLSASIIASAAGLQPFPAIPRDFFEPFSQSYSIETIKRA